LLVDDQALGDDFVFVAVLHDGHLRVHAGVRGLRDPILKGQLPALGLIPPKASIAAGKNSSRICS
jgi:hypothetical protein